METLPAFLRDLFDTGAVTVDPAAAPAQACAATYSLLREQAAACCLELPLTAPGYRPEVAAWAALTFHDACRLLATAGFPAHAAPDAFRELEPPDIDAAACLSADVVFRFLPALMELVRRIAPGSDLAVSLLDVSSRWPLSSIGVQDAQPAAGSLEPVASHPCLAMLYADRVLQRSDVSRLGPPWLEVRIRDAAGAYPELLPLEIRAALDIP